MAVRGLFRARHELFRSREPRSEPDCSRLQQSRLSIRIRTRIAFQPHRSPDCSVVRPEATGGAMASLELSAHLTVRPGCLEGFKRQAAELIRITREKDTHTLRYDWFLSLDGTECEVREAYTGPEGLIEHNRHILDARTTLFKDYADNHFMTVYGEVSEPLLNLLKAHAAGFKWFCFVRGLEPTAVNPARILAAAREDKQPV